MTTETEQAEAPEPADVPLPEDVSRVMAYLGSRRSAKKTEAVRENGKKGGRPRRSLADFPCTCGRGDATEGHPTTCPRGLALYRRKGATP